MRFGHDHFFGSSLLGGDGVLFMKNKQLLGTVALRKRSCACLMIAPNLSSLLAILVSAPNLQLVHGTAFLETFKQPAPRERQRTTSTWARLLDITRRTPASRTKCPLYISRGPTEVTSSARIATHGDLTYRVLEPKNVPSSVSSSVSPGVPVVMIHPVGIGMAAWFWSKVFAAWSAVSLDPEAAVSSIPNFTTGPPPLYALNLRGCAIQDARATNTSVDCSTPLSLQRWVQDTANFISQVVLSSSASQARPNLFDLSFLRREAPPSGCHLVVQGGLAPVGLMLAQEYPSLIRSLSLTSPPEELIVASDEEVSKNLGLLSSTLGDAAIEILLENRLAIRAFSNLFLFDAPCDAEWVDRATAEACADVRKAVQFFNAGGCNGVAASDVRLSQPLLVLEGQADPRRRAREYVSEAPEIEFQTIPGKNVLPWESPLETAQAIQEFIARC